MVRLSAVIMAHPVRRAMAEELQASLDREVPIQYDPVPTPSADPAQRWANGRAAWLRIDTSADWAMVIQDDAIVVPGTLAGLERALEHVPDDVIVCPYVGTKRPPSLVPAIRQAATEADERGASWIRMRSLMWGVAIIAPVATIPGMLAWCDLAGTLSYDKRIGRYYRDQFGYSTWYPWPSLVDHRQGPSICGHDDGGRYAHRMLEGSALEHDWSGPVIDLPTLNRPAPRAVARQVARR